MGKPVDSFDWEDEDYSDIFDYPIGPPIVIEREGGEPFNFFKWLFNMGKTKPPLNILARHYPILEPNREKPNFKRCEGCGAHEHIMKGSKYVCDFCGSDAEISHADPNAKLITVSTKVQKIDKYTAFVRTLPEVPKERENFY